MSLLDEWHEIAAAAAESTPSDTFIGVETRDPRVPHERRVAVGGVVDGRKEKPGVLLVAVISDPDSPPQVLGVCSEIAAQTIMRALKAAWPGLRS